MPQHQVGGLLAGTSPGMAAMASPGPVGAGQKMMAATNMAATNMATTNIAASPLQAGTPALRVGASPHTHPIGTPSPQMALKLSAGSVGGPPELILTPPAAPLPTRHMAPAADACLLPASGATVARGHPDMAFNEYQ